MIIEEVRLLLDSRMINNDKYVVEMILEYIYPKCEKCGDLFLEDKTYETFDGGYVCIYCYTKFIYKRCYTCRKMYHQITNTFCRSCMGSCRVYCSLCLDVEYRRGFIPNRQLIVSTIVDDIIHTAQGLLSHNDRIIDMFEVGDEEYDEDSDLDID